MWMTLSIGGWSCDLQTSLSKLNFPNTAVIKIDGEPKSSRTTSHSSILEINEMEYNEEQHENIKIKSKNEVH